MGGQDRVRPLWRTYARGAEGIMFVLDSADHESFEEAKIELTQLCTHPDTNKLPILILANKQDLPNAYNLDYLNCYLLKEIEANNRNSQREIKLIGGCAVNGDNLDESLEAIYEMILLKKSKLKAKKSK